MLVEAYEHDLIQRACGRWFKRFKTCEFDVKDTEREGQLKKYEGEDLQTL